MYVLYWKKNYKNKWKREPGMAPIFKKGYRPSKIIHLARLLLYAVRPMPVLVLQKGGGVEPNPKEDR